MSRAAHRRAPRLAGLFALLLALPAPALAQAAAPVQTGEHPGFTRIAIAYAATPGWSVVPVEGGWEFRTAGAGPGFDLSRAFDLAGRTRMQALEVMAPDVLRISSTCDCHIEAWTFRGSIPILDLHDGPPRPGSTDIGRYQAAAPPAPEPVPGLAEAVARAAAPAPGAGLTALPPAPDGAAQRRARELEARLGEALGRAGAQEILEPPAPGAPEAAPQPTEALPPRDSHVRIETAVDRDSGSRPGPDPDLTADGAACPDPRRLAISDWGALSDGRPDFARWSGGLVGELGMLDPAAVERAARFHLYLGFGAEARQLLDLLPPSDERGLLAALAAVIDDRPAPPALATWSGCATPAALWGVLAAGGIARGQPVDAGAVVSAFRALPAHLRPVLAPRLVAIFTAAGDSETALRLRALAQSRAGDQSGPAALASARLEAQLQNPGGAEQVLVAALRGPAADSAEVLLELARQRLARGARLTAEEFGALEAHAYQHRGEPLAAALHQVLAAAEIADAAFAAAAARIDGLPDGGDAAQLWRQLFDAAAVRAEPAELLRLTLAHAAALGWSAPDMATRARLAARLLELGFAADALALIEPSPGTAAQPAAEPPLAQELQLLAARAELALGRGAAVLARLADREDAQTYALLAQAQDLLGAREAARRLYALAGRSDEVRRLDYLSGLWPQPPATDGGPPPAAAEARAGTPAPDPASEEAGSGVGDGAGVEIGGGVGGVVSDPPGDGAADAAAGVAPAPSEGPAPDTDADIYAITQQLIARSAEDRARVAALLAQR